MRAIISLLAIVGVKRLQNVTGLVFVIYAMRLNWIHFFLWIWTCFCSCNTIINPPMALEEKNMELIESNDKLKELNTMISCLKTIAGKWFLNKERVPLLVPNFLEDPGLSKPFFAGLQEKLATFSVTENFSSFQNYQETHSAVILVQNSTDLSMLNDLNKLCAPRCRYVVCLLTFYDDETSLLTEANEVVKELWKMWIVNAVVIASAAGKFMVLGSYSFESDSGRIPKKPDILAECSTLAIKPNEYIFHKLLLNHCQVNVTVFDCLPYAQLVVKEGREVITGMEGDLFETIAKNLHMSLNRLNITIENDSTLYDDLLKILDDPDGSDVAFCGLYWGSTTRIEFSLPYEMESVVWMVPSRPALTLSGLVTPLQLDVWFGIIGLLIFTGIIKILLFKKISFLDILGMILGIALARQPTSLSNRIQFASWVFFGYVITQGYLASLAGQLMNTNYETIETMEQLETSGMSLGGTDRHKDLFKDDENPVSRKIYQKYHILNPTEYEDVMAAMKSGRNTSMALVAEMKISRAKIGSGLYEPHKLKENLAGYPVSLAAWKGLPYLDQINAKVSQLSEAGLVNHWSQVYANISSSTVEIHVFRELNMIHLRPSFILLLLGQGLSLIVFFIEIGLYARKNHRLKRR